MPDIKLPPQRQPVTEADAGGNQVFTRPWYLYFRREYARAGGPLGPETSSEDLSQNPIGDGALVDSESRLQNLLSGVDQRPLSDVHSVVSVDDVGPAIQSLRDEIFELRKQIQSLQQGTINL